GLLVESGDHGVDPGHSGGVEIEEHDLIEADVVVYAECRLVHGGDSEASSAEDGELHGRSSEKGVSAPDPLASAIPFVARGGGLSRNPIWVSPRSRLLRAEFRRSLR